MKWIVKTLKELYSDFNLYDYWSTSGSFYYPNLAITALYISWINLRIAETAVEMSDFVQCTYNLTAAADP